MKVASTLERACQATPNMRTLPTGPGWEGKEIVKKPDRR